MHTSAVHKLTAEVPEPPEYLTILLPQQYYSLRQRASYSSVPPTAACLLQQRASYRGVFFIAVSLTAGRRSLHTREDKGSLTPPRGIH